MVSCSLNALICALVTLRILRVQKSIRHTAYHEAGHALVALFTPGADPLHKATINPRGPALGLTWQMPPADEYSRSLTQLRASVDVCMGGQVCIASLKLPGSAGTHTQLAACNAE